MARRRTATIADEVYVDRNPFLDVLLGIISLSERRFGQSFDPSTLRARPADGRPARKRTAPPVRSILR